MADHGWNSFATFNTVPYYARDFLIYHRALTDSEIQEISKGNIPGHRKLRHYYEATEPLRVCNTASDQAVSYSPAQLFPSIIGTYHSGPSNYGYTTIILRSAYKIDLITGQSQQQLGSYTHNTGSIYHFDINPTEAYTVNNDQFTINASRAGAGLQKFFVNLKKVPREISANGTPFKFQNSNIPNLSAPTVSASRLCDIKSPSEEQCCAHNSYSDQDTCLASKGLRPDGSALDADTTPHVPRPAPTKPPTYQTIVGNWESCNKDCGGGTRERKIRCLETDHYGQTDYVSISKCSSVGVPHSREDCNKHKCPQVEPACTDGKHDIEYVDRLHNLSGFPLRVKYDNRDFWYSADPTKTSQPPSHAVILITTVPSSRKTLFWNSYTSHKGHKDPEIYIDSTRIGIYQDDTFDGYVPHNANTGDAITIAIFCDAQAGGSHPGGKLLEAYVKTNNEIKGLHFVNNRGDKVGGSWFAELRPNRHRYKAIRCHQWYTSDERVTAGSIRVILELVGGALSSPPNAPPASFSVIASEWGSCSKDCGGGKRERNLTCKRTIQGITEEVNIINCSGVHNPEREQDCNTNACDNVEQRGGYLKYTGCQGQDDNGGLPDRPQNANWDDCKNLCNEHSNCGGFNHSDQLKMCFLKPRKPGVSTEDYTNCNDWAAKHEFNFYKKQ